MSRAQDLTLQPLEVAPLVFVKQTRVECYMVATLQITLLSPYARRAFHALYKHIVETIEASETPITKNQAHFFEFVKKAAVVTGLNTFTKEHRQFLETCSKVFGYALSKLNCSTLLTMDIFQKTNDFLSNVRERSLLRPFISLSELKREKNDEIHIAYVKVFKGFFVRFLRQDGERMGGYAPILYMHTKTENLVGRIGLSRIYHLVQFLVWRPAHYYCCLLEKPGQRPNLGFSNLTILDSIKDGIRSHADYFIQDREKKDTLAMYVSDEYLTGVPEGFAMPEEVSFTAEMYYADHMRSVWHDVPVVQGVLGADRRPRRRAPGSPYGIAALRVLIARAEKLDFGRLAEEVSRDDSGVERPYKWVHEHWRDEVRVVQHLRARLRLLSLGQGNFNIRWRRASQLEKLGWMLPTTARLTNKDFTQVLAFDFRSLEDVFLKMALLSPPMIHMLRQAQMPPGSRRAALERVWGRVSVSPADVRDLRKEFPGDEAVQDFIVESITDQSLLLGWVKTINIPSSNLHSIVMPTDAPEFSIKGLIANKKVNDTDVITNSFFYLAKVSSVESIYRSSVGELRLLCAFDGQRFDVEVSQKGVFWVIVAAESDFLM